MPTGVNDLRDQARYTSAAIAGTAKYGFMVGLLDGLCGALGGVLRHRLRVSTAHQHGTLLGVCSHFFEIYAPRPTVLRYLFAERTLSCSHGYKSSHRSTPYQPNAVDSPKPCLYLLVMQILATYHVARNRSTWSTGSQAWLDSTPLTESLHRQPHALVSKIWHATRNVVAAVRSTSKMSLARLVYASICAISW
jgi:hypothetical protein